MEMVIAARFGYTEPVPPLHLGRELRELRERRGSEGNNKNFQTLPYLSQLPRSPLPLFSLSSSSLLALTELQIYSQRRTTVLINSWVYRFQSSWNLTDMNIYNPLISYIFIVPD